FITGCLYLSTNSAKAWPSPCLTRNIRAASGSSSTDIAKFANVNQHRGGSNVGRKRRRAVSKKLQTPTSKLQKADQAGGCSFALSLGFKVSMEFGLWPVVL